MIQVPCRDCHGIGTVDSGGVTPWDTPINIPCTLCGGTGYTTQEPQAGDVIQIAPNEEVKKVFHGKLAFVDEVTSWGVKAHIETFDGDAHVRLKWGTFEVIGKAAFISRDREEE